MISENKIKTFFADQKKKSALIDNQFRFIGSADAVGTERNNGHVKSFLSL